MTHSFTVKSIRLEECKAFIRSLPSARFDHNPYKIFDNYQITVSMDSEDGNKMNVLFNKWHEEDKPIVKPVSRWKRFSIFIFGEDTDDYSNKSDNDVYLDYKRRQNEPFY